MAKNWVQRGVLAMGARQQVFAAASLPVQGRQLQRRERTAAMPSKTLLPDILHCLSVVLPSPESGKIY